MLTKVCKTIKPHFNAQEFGFTNKGTYDLVLFSPSKNIMFQVLLIGVTLAKSSLKHPVLARMIKQTMFYAPNTFSPIMSTHSLISATLTSLPGRLSTKHSFFLFSKSFSPAQSLLYRLPRIFYSATFRFNVFRSVATRNVILYPFL